MKVLRAIPLDALCPKCKRGWMRKGSMHRKFAKPGHHLRPAQCKCDRCGYSKTRYIKYVGIEE